MKISLALLFASCARKNLSTRTVQAVEHIRRMPGGAQAQLMRCSDGNLYIVKFRNNPQNQRILANELIVTILSRAIGLPVPEGVIVDVSNVVLKSTPDLYIGLVSSRVPCEPGLQFGSQYAVSPKKGEVFGYMCPEQLGCVRNLETFPGILAVDKWTSNSDSRQAVFWRSLNRRNYTAAFIDHGYCFNGRYWNFPDSPRHGVYVYNEPYTNVRGWDAFEPWLSGIEDMRRDTILEAGDQVPPAWYSGKSCELNDLLRKLYERRTRVRELLTEFRFSPRKPFPNWE